MMNTVEFQGQVLPSWVAEGNHAKFILPFAKQVCKGVGLDIGGNNPEWSLPGAKIIDPAFDPKYDATNLPKNPFKDGFDYIFSSHCLEHVPNWQGVLAYWTLNLRTNGVLFLYLPHQDCLYWQPDLMPTKKHLHKFNPEMIVRELSYLGFKNIFASERDLAWSFAVVGEKC